MTALAGGANQGKSRTMLKIFPRVSQGKIMPKIRCGGEGGILRFVGVGGVNDVSSGHPGDWGGESV